MKKSNVILFSFAILSLLTFAACNNASRTEAAQDKVEAEQGDLQEAREELSEEYQKEQVEIQTEIREAQNSIDKRLVELRTELNDAKPEAKEEINQRISRLQVKRDQLVERLDRADNATNAEWEAFKMDVRTTLNDLKEDLD